MDDPMEVELANILQLQQDNFPEGEDNNDNNDDMHPHPLLIPNVLRDILDLLPISEVEQFRIVSQVWNVEACSTLRKKRTVIFPDYQAIKFYINKLGRTTMFPHTSFEFQIDNLSTGDLPRFWNLFGSHIRRIAFHQPFLQREDIAGLLKTKLTNVTSVDIHHLNRVLLLSKTNSEVRLPSIRHLTFRLISPQDSEAINILEDLFIGAPNLEKISIIPGCIERHLVKSSSNVIDALIRLPNTQESLPNLSELDIKFELNTSRAERLAQKFFPLTTLDVIIPDSVKPHAVKEMLSKFSGTLRNLQILFEDTYTNASSCFPVKPIHNSSLFLPSSSSSSVLADKFPSRTKSSKDHFKNLKHLILRQYNGSKITFVEHLAKLKTICLSTNDVTECFPASGGFQQNKNHGLHTFKTDSFCSTQNIQSIANCFPNLHILHVTGIGDDGLRVIYRDLPYLTELSVLLGNFTDTGISGVPAEVCLDMAETTTYLCVVPEKFRRELFIGSLPRLSVLKVQSKEMTDLSIIFGIISCTRLTSLYIQSDLITDVGIRVIGDKLKLSHLDIGDCTGITEAGRFYVKEKLKGQSLILEPVKIPTTAFIPYRFIQPPQLVNVQLHPPLPFAEPVVAGGPLQIAVLGPNPVANNHHQEQRMEDPEDPDRQDPRLQDDGAMLLRHLRGGVNYRNALRPRPPPWARFHQQEREYLEDIERRNVVAIEFQQRIVEQRRFERQHQHQQLDAYNVLNVIARFPAAHPFQRRHLRPRRVRIQLGSDSSSSDEEAEGQPRVPAEQRRIARHERLAQLERRNHQQQQEEERAGIEIEGILPHFDVEEEEYFVNGQQQQP